MKKSKPNKTILAIVDESEEGEQLWCYCRSPDGTRFMIACDKCEDWFHGDCVNVTPSLAEKIRKYYCSDCMKRHPHLQIVYESDPIKKQKDKKPVLKEKERHIPSLKTRVDEKVIKEYKLDDKKTTGCGKCFNCNRKVDCNLCANCRNKSGQCIQRICQNKNNKGDKQFSINQHSQYKKQLTKLPQAFERPIKSIPSINNPKKSQPRIHSNTNYNSDNLVNIIKRPKLTKSITPLSDSDDSMDSNQLRHSTINRPPPPQPPPPINQQQPPQPPIKKPKLELSNVPFPPQTLNNIPNKKRPIPKINLPLRSVKDVLSSSSSCDGEEEEEIKHVPSPIEKYPIVKKEFNKLSRQINDKIEKHMTTPQIESSDYDDQNDDYNDMESNDDEFDDGPNDNNIESNDDSINNKRTAQPRVIQYHEDDDDDDDDEDDDDVGGGVNENEIDSSFSETNNSDDSNFELMPKTIKKSSRYRSRTKKCNNKTMIDDDIIDSSNNNNINRKKRKSENKSMANYFDESPMSPVDYKSNECKNFDCTQQPRLGSCYCSDECGTAWATKILVTLLPSRLENWCRQPSIADELEKRQLCELNEEIKTITHNLSLLQRTRDDQIRQTIESRQLNNNNAILPNSNSCNSLTNISEDSVTQSTTMPFMSNDDNTSNNVECVTCGLPQSCNRAIIHMESCFQKIESATMVFADQEEFVPPNGSKLFCDFRDPQVQGYCKRLAALCDHFKDPKEGPETICAFPFDSTMKICMTLKKSCTKHVNWERISRAVIDIRRYRLLMRLEDLQNEVNKLKNCISQRGGVMNLLLNETIDHQPYNSIVPPQKPRKKFEKKSDSVWI